MRIENREWFVGTPPGTKWEGETMGRVLFI